MATKTDTIKEGWQKVKLGDMVDFQYGYTASAMSEDTGVKLVRITDIVPDLIDWESIPFCRIEKNKLDHFIIKKGDILTARTGATAGYAKLIRNEPLIKSVFASYLIKMSPKNKEIYSFYVGRIIESDAFKSFVTTNAGGSAQPHANVPVLKNFEFLIPPLPEQKKIADVLSAYDDLIEVNQKKIKVLEDIAQSIYKEWFVKPVKNGIPEGWEEIDLNKKIKLLSGFAFKSKDYIQNGKYKIITIKNVHDGEFMNNFDATLNEFPKNMPHYILLTEGDILLSLTGNVGRVCLNYGENNLLNQRVSKLDTDYRSFAYCLFRNKDFFKKMVLLSNGVAQQNLSPVEVGKIKILIPTESVFKNFEEKVFPIINNIVKLNQQNHNLQKTRDLLIPQLVGGRVSLK